MVQSQSAKEKMQSHAVEEKEQKEQKDTKKNNNEKKTKLEKSMEVLSRSFRQAAEIEAEGFVKMEEMRNKREIDYQLKMKELDNERRREERKHELAIFQLLAQLGFRNSNNVNLAFPQALFMGMLIKEHLEYLIGTLQAGPVTQIAVMKKRARNTLHYNKLPIF